MKNIIVSLLILLMSQSFATAQNFEVSNSANDRMIARYVKESNIPGLAVAVYHKDKLIWSKEYGYANLEYKSEVTRLSKFRIASVSKLFTGTAIYVLHKQGKLNLDDPITKYIDPVPAEWKTITVRQLAQHTSGIGHYADVEDALDVHHYKTTTEAINKFKDRPLMHLPGTDVYYSSYAYTVLAGVIEKVAGKPFLPAMQEIVFDPMGLKNVQADDQSKIIEGRTGFYQYNEVGEIENAPYIDLSGRWAGSGFLSTAADLAKFGAAHTSSSSFFSKQDLNLLTAPLRINDSKVTDEGLGWGKRTGYEGNVMYWGNGRTPGSTAGLLVFPERDLSIAILTNVRNAPLERGEFQIIATRLVADISGEHVLDIQNSDEGEYKLDIEMGGKEYEGELMLKVDKASLGQFNFTGVQNLEIVDAFWKNDELWIFGLAGGKKPIPLGLVPIRVKRLKDGIEGEIFRLGAKFKGAKLNR